MNSKKFIIIALSPVGDGLSGGDRIFIEFAKNLSKRHISVNIVTWDDGIKMCQRNDLTEKQVEFKKIEISSSLQNNFFFCYLARIAKGIWWALTTDISQENQVIYSASDFWMDVFPSAILKLRYKHFIWIAAWYQTAPNPLKGFSEGKRRKKYRSRAFAYWFMQLPVKPLVKVLADRVLVNNESEKEVFKRLNTQRKVKLVLGAVDIDKISEWQKNHNNILKKYDAVFQGRLHPQKGVVELIEIWRMVVDKIPNAQLAMIGDGPLMDEVKNKIRELKLKENVKLFGYVFDGDKKYSTFQSSKIVVHPALYDSGGMAAGEAMAFGLPCVGFNLKSYESYYPKGMVKVPVGSLDVFSEKLIVLLKDTKKRQNIGKEAKNMIENNWSWSERTREVFGENLW